MNLPFRNSLRSLVLVLSLAVMPVLAQAQNCALCYTQAAGSGSKLKAGLKSGILILIFPPMMICTGFMITAWKRRNRFHQKPVETDQGKSDLGW